VTYQLSWASNMQITAKWLYQQSTACDLACWHL